MFSKFNEEARKVLVSAKKEMNNLKHPYIGSEHLLLAILSNKSFNIAKRLLEFNLTYTKFLDEVIKTIGVGNEANNWYLYTPLLKRIIEDAIIDSKENNAGEVTVEHMFFSLLEEGEGVAVRIMAGMGINIDDLYSEFNIGAFNRKNKVKKKLLIEDFGDDMNRRAMQNEIDPVVGREEEIERIIEILCRRTKNNPLLLGEAGVGKSAIVEELARRIAKGEIPNKLKNKRIISITMANIVSGTKYRGEFEDRITKILKEVENDDNIIIFIDEIHTLMGAGGAEGAIDASNILKPALARGKLKVIGATTISEYKKYMEEDRALARRFQCLDIEEPDNNKVLDILFKLRPIYESYHNVKIDDSILKLIPQLSAKYIHDRREPDKSIDILDEVCSRVSISKDNNIIKLNKYREAKNNITSKKNLAIISSNFLNASQLKEKERDIETKINKLEYLLLNKKKVKSVTKEMIAHVIKQKSKIPVYEIVSDNLNYIERLDKDLRSSVIGQDDAIKKLCRATKKIRLGFKTINRPYSFLFIGGTGVGKTFLAKEYARILYGKNNLIRLDMSEYREEHSISKIIGSPPGYVGYSNRKTVFEEIRNNPQAIILLDEIEKANRFVINLFLQVLDEGELKDSLGNTYRFDNNIIIMTSNIGVNKGDIGFNNNVDNFSIEKAKEYLGVEFVNRIDNIVVFNNFKRSDIEIIIKNRIENLKKRFNNLVISKNVVEQIINMSEYETYGARKINKIITDKIEDLIIDGVIGGSDVIKIETI